MTDPTTDGPDLVGQVEIVARSSHDLRYDLTWRLSLGEGAAGAGPAGTATLNLPTGSRVTFDYADPARLLELELGLGTVDDDETFDDLDDLLTLGHLHDLDAAVVSLLVGPDVTVPRTARATVLGRRPTSSRARTYLGRVALIEEHLRMSHVPLDGLWALEAASWVSAAGPGGVLRQWAEAIVQRARPALSLVAGSWAEEAQGNNVHLALQRAIVRCSSLDSVPDALGPVARALLSEIQLRMADDLRHVPDAADLVPVRRGAVAAVLDLVGEPEPQPSVPVSVLVDPSAEGWVSGIPVAVLAGRELVVEVAAAPGVGASLVAGLFSVRVTTAGGVLLAAGSSMGRLDDGRFASRLTLGRSPTTEDLVVVVGRDLPFGAMTRDVLLRRRAVRACRTWVDERRRGASADSLNPLRSVALEAWFALGRNVRDDLDGAPRQTAFLAEQARATTDHPIDGGRAPADSAEALAGARSLAWTMGHVAEAAALEAERLRLPAADGADLSVDQIELLALEARRAGDEDVADPLEAESLRRRYGDDDADVDAPEDDLEDDAVDDDAT